MRELPALHGTQIDRQPGHFIERALVFLVDLGFRERGDDVVAVVV